MCSDLNKERGNGALVARLRAGNELGNVHLMAVEQRGKTLDQMRGISDFNLHLDGSGHGRARARGSAFHHDQQIQLSTFQRQGRFDQRNRVP